ncbi:hypothetical protein F8388_002622, partial [Cannabis sativa]
MLISLSPPVDLSAETKADSIEEIFERERSALGKKEANLSAFTKTWLELYYYEEDLEEDLTSTHLQKNGEFIREKRNLVFHFSRQDPSSQIPEEIFKRLWWFMDWRYSSCIVQHTMRFFMKSIIPHGGFRKYYSHRKKKHLEVYHTCLEGLVHIRARLAVAAYPGKQVNARIIGVAVDYDSRKSRFFSDVVQFQHGAGNIPMVLEVGICGMELGHVRDIRLTYSRLKNGGTTVKYEKEATMRYFLGNHYEKIQRIQRRRKIRYVKYYVKLKNWQEEIVRMLMRL